ncbi:MAG: tetraacyldisaccharide 4'-kinase [Nitrosomonas sp.]|nr:tetraacyldisaccharide 4'-kinase [Nitrosomonas sp.]
MKLTELYWHRITPLHILLWPLSLLFGLFISLRKLCYWLDFFPSVKLHVPVIIVDSITSDDAGKTLLTLWLIDNLLAHGLRPGIVARGNLDNPGQPEAVSNTSDPINVGDKAVLLASHLHQQCPVWVGGDPAATATALLKANPACNIIISTHGLQYPRLERDIEIAVVDFSDTSFGNGLRLPAGPLRTSLKSLRNVDAVIINGTHADRYDTSDWAPTYTMKLAGQTVYNLSEPGNRQPASVLKNKKLLAVCRYVNMPWFWEQLQRTGLQGDLHGFNEEHRYIEEDFLKFENEIIIMPEEEALQCTGFKPIAIWALPVEIWINEDKLQSLILNRLKEKYPDVELTTTAD